MVLFVRMVCCPEDVFDLVVARGWGDTAECCDVKINSHSTLGLMPYAADVSTINPYALCLMSTTSALVSVMCE